MRTGFAEVSACGIINLDMMNSWDPLSTLFAFQGSLRTFRQIISFQVDELAFRLGRVGSVYVETDEWDRKTVVRQG